MLVVCGVVIKEKRCLETVVEVILLLVEWAVSRVWGAVVCSSGMMVEGIKSTRIGEGHDLRTGRLRKASGRDVYLFHIIDIESCAHSAMSTWADSSWYSTRF